MAELFISIFGAVAWFGGVLLLVLMAVLPLRMQWADGGPPESMP
jgi:hypothetical protein